jgi:glutamate dehydrogenase
MDVDIQSEPVTVAGVGDMSGDVFGNGMLLSRSLKLVAAFDHRDIFLDPDPGPGSLVQERERLFALPRRAGGLRQGPDLGGRRRVLAPAKVDPALARGAALLGLDRRRRRPPRSCARS